MNGKQMSLEQITGCETTSTKKIILFLHMCKKSRTFAAHKCANVKQSRHK